MKAVVLGGGTWGTGFSRCSPIAVRGHACDPPRRGRAAIAETGRNPRYSSSVDLAGIAATTIAEAPYEGPTSS